MTDFNLDAGELNITVRHRNDWTFRAHMYDRAGELVTDLPTEGWVAQLRSARDEDSELVGAIDIDASNAAEGYVDCRIPIVPPDTYYFDVQYPHSELGPRTPFGGRITVTRNVTHV